MDLTNAYDHPAKLLEEGGWHSAATELLDQEIIRDVTFAALDNKALEALRKEYLDHPDSIDCGLINALLGFEDE